MIVKILKKNGINNKHNNIKKYHNNIKTRIKQKKNDYKIEL